MKKGKKRKATTEKIRVRLLSQRVSLFGKGKDGSTVCEIHGLHHKEDGQFEGLPLLLIEMRTRIAGFSIGGDPKKFNLLCEFVDGIFGVLLQTACTDEVGQALITEEEARQHIEALRRIVFANELGIEKTKIAQILKWRTIPSAKAHAWLWFDLIRKLSPIIEPLDKAKDFASDRIKLRDKLPNDHGLVKAARDHFVKGKVNTTQSLAYRIYHSLMIEHETKMPNLKETKNELKDFIRYKNVRNADPQGYIQQLKIEGFDYHFIMGGKGFDRTLG